MKRYRISFFLTLLLVTISPSGSDAQVYWNSHTQLIPWRMPLPGQFEVTYSDIDHDGDPDLIHTLINDSIPVLWIDDDDDMEYGDLEGDTDSDCFCADIDRDGLYGGQRDLCVDWTDTDSDGLAEVQAVVINGGREHRNYFDWEADFMYIIDWGEEDGIMNFINWNELVLRAWEHNGHANFFTDYHGNTLFLKMHGSTFRISDVRFSWENPFIFYNFDKDGMSEMAIRLVDTPHFRPADAQAQKEEFNVVDPEHDVLYTKRIDYVAMTWDLDNDNGQGNEFDYDMSIKFSGKGFDYSDQLHHFTGMRGLPEADSLFFDPRWRQNDVLIYPDQDAAYGKVFNEGDWDYCWFVFDEDDDCNRWERVEFYEPKDIWRIGADNGGVDNNKQADAVGDRGEFDLDNSGHGNLYVSPFDGRLHLYGAEWGVWRVDINARSFQGFGGLYPSARRIHSRDQTQPQTWATFRYSDSDNNGYFDLIQYDLDGDTILEEQVSLRELGIDDKSEIINTGEASYKLLNRTFGKLTRQLWKRSRRVLKIADNMNINTDWYAFWQQPRTLNEKYQYSYWLTFYLYRDMRHIATLAGDTDFTELLDKAYYSGDWRNIKIRSSRNKSISRPNFLFILIDDQPYDAFGHSGRYPFLKTPNIDRLAQQGVRFENFFCTVALCSPSRASFLTGTYPHIHGVTQNDPRVDPDWENYPPFTVSLQKAGYETAMVGKIHMKQMPGEQHVRPGFDYWLSFQGQGEYIDPILNENGREFMEKGYMTDILTRYAVDWLRQKHDRSKPFSLLVWHKAVHEPFTPPERHWNLFSDESLPQPPHGTAFETFLGKPEWQRIKAFDSRWRDYKPVDQLPVREWDPKHKMFTALLECIPSVDESVGELLKVLEEMGELDNTVVIYGSDNGYFMGEHTYWDKRIAYDPSMRIPLIMRLPEGIYGGMTVQELCTNIDVAPTILDLAGAKIPEYMQGESMMQLLKQGNKKSWRKSFLFEYYVDDAYPYAGPDMLAVRTDSFKLVNSFLENDIDELYDLKNDPGEMNNLISDPAYESVRKRLGEELENLKNQYRYTADRDWWLRKETADSVAMDHGKARGEK